MSHRERIGIVNTSEGAPQAVLGAVSDTREPGTAWAGRYPAIRAMEAGGRLLPAGAIFCPALTERWGRLVACTPEFAAWYLERHRAAPQSDFSLEVWS